MIIQYCVLALTATNTVLSVYAIGQRRDAINLAEKRLKHAKKELNRAKRAKVAKA